MNILNNKDSRKLLALAEEQWSCDLRHLLKDFSLVQSEKGKIYLVTRDIHSIDTESLHINSFGVYVFTIRDHKIRITIEGSQLVGPLATKNVVAINDDNAERWIRGNDLKKDCDTCKGTVIIKHKNDFMGSGPYKEGTILNYVAKSRRITSESKTP